MNHTEIRPADFPADVVDVSVGADGSAFISAEDGHSALFFALTNDERKALRRALKRS